MFNSKFILIDTVSHKSHSPGARLAIQLLVNAVENEELDPWDIDVINVIDSFLDKMTCRISTQAINEKDLLHIYLHLRKIFKRLVKLF